ncbi:MAG: c-type cytochrome domain-containing protein [Phycisphaerae bacterium]
MSKKRCQNTLWWSAAALISGSILAGTGLAGAISGRYVLSTFTGPVSTLYSAATDAHHIHLDGSINVYRRLIQPIFIQNCIMCHGVNRQKGHLRLDTYQYVMYGKFGHKVVLPGNPNGSILMRRVTLPTWNHHRMPPRGHAGLSSSQILLLRWWIQTGADDTGTLRSLHANRTVDEAAQSELRIVKRFMPRPITRIKNTIRRIEAKTGVSIHVIRAGLPWLSCDASGKSDFNNHDLYMLSPIASNVVVLKIGGTAVTDRGLTPVNRMVNLIYLHLDHTTITNSGLERLNDLSHLRYLKLTGTRISNAGVDIFKRNNHLRRLWVAGLR